MKKISARIIELNEQSLHKHQNSFARHLDDRVSLDERRLELDLLPRKQTHLRLLLLYSFAPKFYATIYVSCAACV